MLVGLAHKEIVKLLLLKLKPDPDKYWLFALTKFAAPIPLILLLVSIVTPLLVKL